MPYKRTHTHTIRVLLTFFFLMLNKRFSVCICDRKNKTQAEVKNKRSC